MNRHLFISLCLLLSIALPALAQDGDKKWEKQSSLPGHLKPPPSPPLSPGETLKSFQLVGGFRIELIAHEPMVQDPVAVSFDEDGRLWVAEMRGYMTNLKGDGEHEPTGRVSVLEDIDGDGVMDRGTVFLDGLVLPRAIANVKDGALIADFRKLIFAEDLDGDGKADRIRTVDPDYSGAGNVEHSPNGLLRGLDNWYYNAKSRSRYRLQGSRWVEEETEFRGQWGITQDDFGRLFYNYNWDQLRGDFVPPNTFNRNPHHQPSTGINEPVATNQTVFPIRMNTSVNRGYRPGVLDDGGKLYEFASACAPLIYRGDQFPSEFRGNAFVCGPGANIVKRNVLIEDGARVSAKHAYDDREFLASTDERFRPVALSNGPDGALYVVDMYRGVIQHRDYMTTHLRNEIVSRKLDTPINHGRIYRIVSTAGEAPASAERLSQASDLELVERLSYSNGWIRDTAQRLLVERNAVAAAPRITSLANSPESSPRARIHALWTLEGLGRRDFKASPDLIRVFDDRDPNFNPAAARAFDQLNESNPRARLELALRQFEGLGEREPDPRFLLQFVHNCRVFPAEDRFDHLGALVGHFSDDPLLRDAALSELENLEWRFMERLFSGAPLSEETQGKTLFLEALAAAALHSGRSGDIKKMIALLDDAAGRFDWRHNAILNGLAVSAGRRGAKPIRLWKEPLFLRDIESVEDRQTRWRLNRVKNLFAWRGHNPAAQSGGKAERLTPAQEDLFALGRQKFLLTCAPCHGADGAGMKPLGPPLLDSEWVLGPSDRLMRIVLHGLEGPIHVNGKQYGPPDTLPNMPSVGVMTSEELAAILTYIRRAWDHQADPIMPAMVTRTRDSTLDRQTPWTEKELLEIE